MKALGDKDRCLRQRLGTDDLLGVADEGGAHGGVPVALGGAAADGRDVTACVGRQPARRDPLMHELLDLGRERPGELRGKRVG